MPQADLIKLLVSHIVAAVMALGGVIAIVFLFLNTPEERLGELAGILALIGGFVGAATTFLWQTNTQAAARGQTRNDLLTQTVDTPPEDLA